MKIFFVTNVSFLGYIRNNQAKKAIDLFHEINKPDHVIFILMFQACAQLETKEAVNLIRLLRSKMPTSFYSNPRLLTSFIDALMNCEDVQTAEIFFNKVQVKSISIYGAMIKGTKMIVMFSSISSDICSSIGYVKSKQINKAIDLFHQIDKPDDVIFILMFQACAQLETQEALDLIRFLRSKMPTSFYSNPRLLTSFIDALMNCEDVQTAEIFFNKVQVKSISIYGAMIKGTKMIVMFSSISSDICSFVGYVKSKQINKAIDLFHQMNEPNDVIFILMFQACAQLETKEAVDLIRFLRSKMPTSFYSNPHLLTSFIDALMNCEDVQTAEIFFNKVQVKSISIYGAMIKGTKMTVMFSSISSDICSSIGYVKSKQINKAIDLFHQIDKPDDVIFILMFQACAQLGKKGALTLIQSFLTKMPTSFYSNPRLLTSLIDGFVKCGDMKRAEEFFKKSTVKGLLIYATVMKGMFVHQIFNI